MYNAVIKPVSFFSLFKTDGREPLSFAASQMPGKSGFHQLELTVAQTVDAFRKYGWFVTYQIVSP